MAMARSRAWLAAALAATAGATIGCAHCDTCDDFPAPCGPSAAWGPPGAVPVGPSYQVGPPGAMSHPAGQIPAGQLAPAAPSSARTAPTDPETMPTAPEIPPRDDPSTETPPPPGMP